MIKTTTAKIKRNEEMKKIAEVHKRSIAQICIAYVLQNGILPLPKSVTPERIQSNTQVFDIELSEQECQIIANLKDTGISPVRNPDEIEF